nr:immunoglobulin light chain junction region [Mus musculus]NSM00165.1 immunoglobulin light chain junction region [Mus musculus]
CQQSNTLPLTF